MVGLSTIAMPGGVGVSHEGHWSNWVGGSWLVSSAEQQAGTVMRINDVLVSHQITEHTCS